MNERGTSDRLAVRANLSNKAVEAEGEVGEARRRAKGNTDSKTQPGHSAGTDASSALGRVREVARRDKDARFTALLHHVSPGRLRAAYWAIRPQAAPGVDGVTWTDYGQDLEESLQDLHARVQAGRYRAKPSRRAYIPKADGRQRPLGIAALEDKIVQRAVVEVFNAVYEVDFRGFSYGFRPGRSPHEALDALAVGISRKKVNWVLDADIRDFFGQLDHAWLRRFLEHRIADKRVLRLIGKWLAAGGIGFAVARERVPALRPRPVGRLVEAPPRVRRCDHRAVGGRLHRRVRARTGCAAVPGRASPAVRGVRSGVAPGQDSADRVRALCRPTPAGAGSGQAGDVRFPWLHAHLREVQERAVLAEAHHDLETDAGEATRGQRPAQASPAPAHSGAREVAGQCGARAYGLLCRAR